MKIPLSTLNKVNVWRLPSGELATRPGLRRLWINTGRRAAELGGGFTLLNSLTGEVFHYIYEVSTEGLETQLIVLDEDFSIYKVLGLGVNVVPRAMSPIVVRDQMLISSPDHATLYGVPFGDIGYAVKQDSISGSNTIDVPRGVGIIWQGRPVICSGTVVAVGDPIVASGGDLRSFIGENANSPGGEIYGVHVGAGGMLIIVTDSGVLGLDAAAATVGIIGTANVDWRILSHHAAFAFESSCVVRGRLFALSRDGIILADVEDGAEITLDEPAQSRALYHRTEGGDYRTARLLAADEGPAVALEADNALWMSDRRSGLMSWWRTEIDDGDMRVRGFLRDVDGTQLILTANGVFRVEGDHDGNVVFDDAAEIQPTGVLVGRMDPGDSDNILIEEIRVRAAVGGTGGGELTAAVHGKAHSLAAPVDAKGLTIGVDDWSQPGRRYTSTPVTSVGIKFGQADASSGRDPTFEVGIPGCNVVIDDPSVIVASSAAERVARKG